MEDDRPIRPSQQYIRDLNQPAERVVMNQNNYLKRSSGKYLPCFSQTKLKLTHPLNQSPKNQMSKRQIYQRIKSENQALYGKQKKNKKQDQEDRQTAQTDILKKQRAKRIQLYLKSKSNNIEINQQKIEIQEPMKPHAKTSSSTNKNKDEKQKYQRLIKQMQKERELLKKQRQQFQQQKLLLQFRKDIKNQQGIKSKKVKQLSFDKRNKQNQYYNITNKTPYNNNNTKSHKSNYNSNPLLNESQNSATDKKASFSNRKDFKIDLVESKKLIQNISQKIIQIQSNQKHNLQRNQTNDKSSKSKFQLQSLLSINNFSIQVFSNKNDQVLIHTNNKYYQQFLNRQRTLKVLSKQKQGNKQIIKYQDGSFTKNSKKYRLVQFPNGYKLTIFQNHDVKQQIPGGMVCYYSKMRDVNKISYNQNFDIYYFYKQKQIEVHYKPSGRKEILYKNGIKRTVIGSNI